MTRGQHLGPLLLAALAFASVACDKSDPSAAAPSAEPTPPAPAPIASAAPPPSAEPEATASAAPEVASAAPAASANAKPAAAPAAKPAATGKALAAEPAKSAAPERKVKTVGGTSASSDSFSLSISAPSPVRAGESANAAIVLSARAPYHCNPKYPYKFAVDGGSTLRGMSVSDKTATLAVPFTPSQKGHTTLSGTLSFSVCTADKCLIEKRKLSVSVDVD